MRRREFITLLGSAVATWPLAAHAQQPARYRIGHLAIAAPTDTPPPPPANWDAFVQGLREAGYIEGRNLEFEHRSAHDQPELFPKLASELADVKVDVIFARGTWALAAAHPDKFAAIMPICGGGDPHDAAKLKHLAIWVFHGAKDSVVPPNRSESMVKALKEHNAENLKFMLYPDANHDSWTETYDNPEVWDWLLKQKRDSARPAASR